MVRTGLRDGRMNNKILTLKEVTEYPKLVENIFTTDGKSIRFRVDGGRLRFKQFKIQSWIEQQKKEGAK